MQIGQIKEKWITKWNNLTLRWKIYSLFAATLSVAILAVLIRGQSIFQNDKNLFVNDLNSKLSSSTAMGLSNRIEMLESKLVLLATTKDAPAQEKILLSQAKEFLAVGLVQIDNQNRVTIPWTSKNTADIDEKFIFLNKINLTNTTGTREFFILPESHYIVFSLRIEIAAPTAAALPTKTWMVGILQPTAFDTILSLYSTGVNHGYIVDQNNVALASSESTLQGRTFNFTKSIESSNTIPGTNLKVVVTTTKEKAFAGRWVYIRSILIIGLSVLLFSFALITFFTDTYISGPLKSLASLISEGRYNAPFNVLGNDEISDTAKNLKKIEVRNSLNTAKVLKEQNDIRKIEKARVYELMCGAISREIKNPLSGVLGQLQLALAQELSPDVTKCLKISEKEIRRCRAVIENLGRLSGTEKMIYQPLTLVEVAQNAIELVEVQLSQAHCKLYKELRPCSAVLGDAGHLQNVIAALLRNAAQAIDGSIKKNIFIRIFEVEGRARLQVEDSGLGIPVEFQDRIFEPFFTTKPTGKGVGLGLASSRGVIREHKGDIWFESEKYKTVFTIDLPTQKTLVTKNDLVSTPNFQPKTSLEFELN